MFGLTPSSVRRWWPALLAAAGLHLAAGNAVAQTTPDAAASTPQWNSQRQSGYRPPATATTIEQIPAGTPEDIEAGRRIYMEGILTSGKPLIGHRLDGGVKISGERAACVLCHRRSGLGAIEGHNRVSPITGRYLFKQDPRAVIQMNVRTERGFNRKHDPYTLETFSAAVRGGIHVSGREMLPLMPRYELEDRDVQVLASYLRQLSAEWSPGVSDKRIRFATVVTPDVDPARKAAFVQTMQTIVNQRNGNIVGTGQRTMSSGAEMILQTARAWDLDVWELQGAPETWAAQLQQRYEAEPVFALVSGLGGTRWAPVHSFCENNRIPCWFPSVQQAPAEAEDDFYSIYYSSGIPLEASVLGRHLGEGEAKPRRVLQVYTDAALKEGSIDALQQALNGYKIGNEVLHWNGKDRAVLAKALARLGKADAVAFWIDPAALTVLAEITPPPAQAYFSGRLLQGEAAPLPAAWKPQARLVYPYQLPSQRGKALVYFHQWAKERKVNLVDEPMQSEVYFAMTYLIDTLVNMLDNVHRDLLLERAENELSLRESAAAENQAREVAQARQHVVAADRARPMRPLTPRPLTRPQPDRDMVGTGPLQGRAGSRIGVDGGFIEAATPTQPSQEVVQAASDKRSQSTTIYPRLSLAQFQRLASKGAYIVHFAAPDSQELVADTGWIVP
ncbi:MAG: hypothetical protein RJA44_2002 [Pseudomonadota bacterium]